MPQINCHNFSPLFWHCYCHKSIATIFFFFFKFLPKISATWLSQFFFPPIFSNLVATIHIFSLLPSLKFQQLGCHNWFPLALALWALHTHLGSSFRQ